MRRRDAVRTIAAGAGLFTAARGTAEGAARTTQGGGRPLSPPRTGKIPVAVLISEGATVIDFAGPWEVFQDVHVEGRGSRMEDMTPFELFTVAEHAEPIEASGGLRIVPSYTFRNVPRPRVVVVGAQAGRTPAVYVSNPGGGQLSWLAWRLHGWWRSGEPASALAIEGLALEMLAVSARRRAAGRSRRGAYRKRCMT